MRINVKNDFIDDFQRCIPIGAKQLKMVAIRKFWSRPSIQTEYL